MQREFFSDCILLISSQKLPVVVDVGVSMVEIAAIAKNTLQNN